MPFRTALSGLNAATSDLNVTANNIANSNTVGFKSSRAEFADVFTSGALDFRQNQVGSGVKLASISQQFAQGSVNFTNSNLDLALSGEGFFTLRDSSGLVYTRNGTFSVDRDGYVVNSQTQRLQAFPAIAGAPGQFNTGALTDVRLTSSQSDPNASTLATVVANLPAGAAPPAVAVFDPNDPQSYNNTTSTALYDSLGNALTATLFFIKTATPNQWNVAVTVDGTQVGGLSPLEFSPTGGVINPANGQIVLPAYAPPTGANPLNVTFDFIDSTQFGGDFGVSSLIQDGYSSGRLTSIDIGETGVIFARFTNGRAVELGKLALSNFPNQQGLKQLGDTTWAESFRSGGVIRGEAGSASFGLIQSGALEGSNVDLTNELVNMITAQRAFQANAQVITTADQITQSILQIR